jgi:hypothetical protein
LHQRPRGAKGCRNGHHCPRAQSADRRRSRLCHLSARRRGQGVDLESWRASPDRLAER